jgi:hypothetical protein
LSTRPRLDAAAVKALSEARNLFRADPTWATVEAATQLCKVILAGALQTDVKLDPPPKFDCELQGAATRQLLTLRDQVVAGRASFSKACAFEQSKLKTEITDLSQRVHIKQISLSAGFLQAGELIEPCVSSAKATGLTEQEVLSFLDQTEHFIRSQSPDRNRFEQARAAFWSSTPDSTMALGIAVVQDAFILILILLAGILNPFKRRTPRFEAARDSATGDQ